jgi:hypothetical protein
MWPLERKMILGEYPNEYFWMAIADAWEELAESIAECQKEMRHRIKERLPLEMDFKEE